jgi:ABC-type phosphate transport system substrate-binding protein
MMQATVVVADAAGAAFVAASGGSEAPAATSAEPTRTPAAAVPASGSAGIVTGLLEGEAKALTGVGATFPVAVHSKWFNDYNQITQIQVNYQAIGSGGGIKAISDQTADFGATDSPMTDAHLKDAKGGDILKLTGDLGCAPLPTEIVTKGEAMLRSIQAHGKAAIPSN